MIVNLGDKFVCHTDFWVNNYYVTKDTIFTVSEIRLATKSYITFNTDTAITVILCSDDLPSKLRKMR